MTVEKRYFNTTALLEVAALLLKLFKNDSVEQRLSYFFAVLKLIKNEFFGQAYTYWLPAVLRQYVWLT